MERRMTKWVRVGMLMAVVGVAFMVPTVAKADHDSFLYEGSTCGAPGEAEMIQALEHIDRVSRSHEPSFTCVRRAIVLVHQACGLVSSSRSRYMLHGAKEHLEMFLYTQARCDLEDAGRLVSRALANEQYVYRSMHDTHRYSYDRSPYMPRGPVVISPSRPVIVPSRPVVVTPSPWWHNRGLDLGGNNWAVRLRF